jgi:hypothetical protein
MHMEKQGLLEYATGGIAMLNRMKHESAEVALYYALDWVGPSRNFIDG